MQDLLGAQSDRLPEEQTFLSGAEKFFQIRAESFGPLEAKVFPFFRGRGLPHWNVRFSSDCVRYTPNSRNSLGDVHYRADFVRFTPNSGRKWVTVFRSACDPTRTFERV